MKFKINACDGIYSNCLDVRFTKSCDNNCSFCIEKNGIDNLGETNVNQMIVNTIKSNKKTVLILGGEPFLNLNKLLQYIKGIRSYVQNIYITTSLLEHQSKMYVKLNKKNGKTTGLKNDFIIGWLKGLEDKFRVQVESVKEYGLILVKDALVVAEVEKMKLRTGQRSKITANRDADARNAGYKSGNSFNGNSKMIECNC